MKNRIRFAVFALSLTLLSCGGGKNDTGSVSFGLKFEQTSAASEIKPAPSAASAVDICASYGIDSISGTVYNSSNTVIATGGPWACSAHQGTITNIPAGSNLKIEIKGTVASSVVWQGETTGVTVTADHDTDVGTVTMTYIGSDTTPPTISSFTPSDSDINVPVTTVITATFSENISEPTINTDTFTLYDNSAEGYVNGDVTYDSSTKTATFTPSGNLSYSSNYTAEIMQGATGVQDLTGWMLQGTSKWNFITEAVPTSAPSASPDLTATAEDGQVTISWTAVTGATSYNLYWSNTSGVTKSNGTKITGATSPYIHTTLSNGTTYYYVVTAVNGYGESEESSQVYATPQISIPSVPTGVSATGGDGETTISWGTVIGATSYKVYWSTTSGSGTGGIAIAVENAISYTHTGLANGTSYYYVVTAVNGGGESTASGQVSATPQVPVSGVPTGVSATAGDGQVTINWSTVTEATSYKVYWSTTSGSGTGGTAIAVESVNTYTHTGLTNGTSYYYVVTAVNAGGESAASAQTSAMPVPPVPSAPTGVAAAAGNTQTTISWAAVTGTTSYNLYWSTTTGVTTSNGTKITGATSPYIHTGLTNGTTYYYIITAVNIGGESTASSQVSVIPSLLMGGSIQGTLLNLTSTNATVTTFAGSAGIVGSTDGTGAAARFNFPFGITTDGANIFIADSFNHMIRKMTIATGAVTTIAGSPGIIGTADGIGSNTRFYEPRGIATDGTNLFIADFRNNTIRKIVISTGVVTTIAGSAGSAGSTDGTGTVARFNSPIGITTDGTNLFVADSYNYTIRKIVISTGAVTTIAGSAGLAGSTDGTGSAARFWDIYGITTDGANLFVTDTLNSTIRKVTISTGVVTTIAGSAGLTGSTDGTGTAARFINPFGITTDGTNLFVGDGVNSTIRKIVISTGTVTTIAGSAGLAGSTDGTGTVARFNSPTGITTDGTNLFVSDNNNHTIRKIQ